MITNQPVPPPQARTFWVLDGDSKAYDLKEEIKAHGGYFERDHKAWCIDDPTESTVNVFKSSGLKIQFRRYKVGTR